MTDEQKALVERLRDTASQGVFMAMENGRYASPHEAADRIEELTTEAAENARIIGMSAEREMALRGEVERLTPTVRKLQGYQGALEAEVKGLRNLLREAEVKLTDVQGAYATGKYATNLLARIRAALEKQHD